MIEFEERNILIPLGFKQIKCVLVCHNGFYSSVKMQVVAFNIEPVVLKRVQSKKNVNV